MAAPSVRYILTSDSWLNYDTSVSSAADGWSAHPDPVAGDFMVAWNMGTPTGWTRVSSYLATKVCSGPTDKTTFPAGYPSALIVMQGAAALANTDITYGDVAGTSGVVPKPPGAGSSPDTFNVVLVRHGLYTSDFEYEGINVPASGYPSTLNVGGVVFTAYPWDYLNISFIPWTFKAAPNDAVLIADSQSLGEGYYIAAITNASSAFNPAVSGHQMV